MSIIKIEFPADRPDIAKVLGAALITLSEIGAKTVGKVQELGEGYAGAAETVKDIQHEPALGSAVSQDAGSDDNGMFTEPELEESQRLMDAANTDTKGVPFNEEFCGKAAKPFYASGKRVGQWKKRQGVDDLVYDSWYAAELAKAPTTSSTTENTVNTASAFGNQAQGQQQQSIAEPTAPHDAGTLMAWVSEMQAASRITQQQVNEAYQQAGVTMTDVFPGPNKTEVTIAQAVQAVHAILLSWT